MGDPATCTDAGFLARFPGFELLPHAIRLLAFGEPVSVQDIAAAAGASAGEVEELFHGKQGSEWDEHGRLVGFGLTLRPTAHRLIVAGRSLYTWCAIDTLFFPLVLGEPAVAHSHCPATGQSIRVEVSLDAAPSSDPDTAVVSQITACEVDDVRGEVCDHGHFFASEHAARGWVREHDNGRVTAVREAFEQAAKACEALGWHAPALRPAE